MVFGKKAAAQTEPRTVNSAPVQELPPTSAHVATQLKEAREKAEQAVQALDAASANYRDAPSLELKHAELSAEVSRDVADKTVERLERALVEAQEREAEEARQRQYDVAAECAKAIPDRLRRWDELSAELATLAAQIDEDTQIINSANANRPKGAERLRTLEDHRARPSRTETVKTRHQGWIIEATGEPYRGAMMINEHGRPNVRGIIRGEYQEQVEKLTPAYTPERLLGTLVLPASNGSKLWPRKN